MIRLLLVGLLVGCMTGMVQVQGAGADEEVRRGIALVRVGETPEDLVVRVRDFVERNTAIPVRIRDARPAEGDSLTDIGRRLTGLMEPEDVFLIALARPESEFEEHAVYLYDQNVAVVNARVLEHPDDPETYGRRLEKITMRSIGLMLGVDPVPNPHSAMYPYRSMKELDAMGRNYDPPTLINVQKAAVEQGMDLIRESPYIIIDH